MKIRPNHTDFEAMPVIDFTGKLDTPIAYDNTYEQLLEGMKNEEYRRHIGDSVQAEVFNRAYNYTAKVFAGYNRLAYICMMYAEEVRKHFMYESLQMQWSHDYLIGLLVCNMSGAGEGEIKGPYLIVGADDERDAEDEYNGRVPLSSYYPSLVLAVREKGKDWQVSDDKLSRHELRKILDGGDVRRVR